MGSLNEMAGNLLNSNWNWYTWCESNQLIFTIYILCLSNGIGVLNLPSRRSLATLILGVFVGFILAAVFISTSDSDRLTCSSDPHTGSELIDAIGPERDVGYHASHEAAHALENKTIAQQLYNEVRVFCWIMTTPKNHKKKARHVKRTWGSRCNKLIFMSSEKGNFLIRICIRW